MCLIWFHNDISSPSLEPTKSPTGSPSSSPTVHPFRGYEWVGSGPGGECEDSNGELYSWVEFTNTVSDIGSAEDCAHRCEELVTAEQEGIGRFLQTGDDKLDVFESGGDKHEVSKHRRLPVRNFVFRSMQC